MNEIPKTSISPQTTKVEQLKPEVATEQPAEVAVEQAQVKEINEIPDNPADRSTVKVDNLKADIETFVANPELAAKALEVAELAEKRYSEANIQDPELKALAVGKAFVEEFQK